MKKILVLFGLLYLFLTPLGAFADGDKPNLDSKPVPKIYSHEESDENDKKLIADEEYIVIGGLSVGVITLGDLLWKKSKDSGL